MPRSIQVALACLLVAFAAPVADQVDRATTDHREPALPAVDDFADQGAWVCVPEQPEEPEPEPVKHAEVKQLPADPVTGIVPSGPMIVMISQASCPPCDRWWAGKDRWVSVGWQVAKVDISTTTVDRTPTFRIFHRGAWLDESPTTLTPEIARQLTGAKLASNVVVKQTSNYAPRWSYPGELRSHVADWPHNIDPSGMSQDAIEVYHDQWHDQNGSVSAAQLRAKSFTPQDCPPGGT